MLGGCFLFLDDVKIDWTVDGSSSSSACSSYGIERWEWRMDGPERANGYRLCNESWGSGFINNVIEGYYTITVTALDSTGNVLASKTQTRDFLSEFGPHYVDFNFTLSDFQ